MLLTIFEVFGNIILVMSKLVMSIFCYQLKMAWITLGTSSNMIGNSYDEGSFTDKLLLNNRQVANLCKAFAINLSTNINHQKLRH